MLRVSHPTWVRGLKLYVPSHALLLPRRILHGCVDWNIKCYIVGIFTYVASYMGAWIETVILINKIVDKYVASYMGAWIETWFIASISNMILSHPTWVRGLKRCLYLWDKQLLLRRILHGCVDWNFRIKRSREHRTTSHPTWVRGLKHCCRFNRPYQICRILHGCVDWNISL